MALSIINNLHTLATGISTAVDEDTVILNNIAKNLKRMQISQKSERKYVAY